VYANCTLVLAVVMESSLYNPAEQRKEITKSRELLTEFVTCNVTDLGQQEFRMFLKVVTDFKDV
jgi:hypothetical protein